MRPFLFERKILCFPLWLACHSRYAFGVQHVQCISNYCHSWLASKSAVLKNMKCKLGSLFYLGFCCCCFLLLLLWKSICSLFFFLMKDLILTSGCISPLFSQNALAFLLMSAADSRQFPAKKQHCSWLCLLLNILNIISDHPWRNTRRNSSASTNTVTILPRLCVKPALENVIKLSDKQGSAWELHIYHEQSSILISKIFHYPHFLPKIE